MARGQIIERKSGFTVRVFVGRDSEGKRIYQNQRVTGTKKDAQRVLTAMLRKLDTGELLLNPTTMTVRAYCEEWLETIARPRLARSTFTRYSHYILKKVSPALGKRKLTRLEPRDVQAFYASLSADGLSPRSVQYTHAVLNSALKHAVSQRLIPSNPCQHVQLPKQQDTEMNAMSESEVNAFLKTAEGNRMGVYFDLLLATGLRPSEGLALKWKDIDATAKTLRVVRTIEYISGRVYFKDPKTRRSRRTINLHDATVSLLLDHRPAHAAPGDLVFPSLEGTPMNTNNVLNRYFKPCLLAAGLAELVVTPKGKEKVVSKFRMYDLRHTHATMLLKANVNPKIVSERLGHASVSLTLDTYSHVLPTIQDAAVEALGASLYSGRDERPEVPLN